MGADRRLDPLGAPFQSLFLFSSRNFSSACSLVSNPKGMMKFFVFLFLIANLSLTSMISRLDFSASYLLERNQIAEVVLDGPLVDGMNRLRAAEYLHQPIVVEAVVPRKDRRCSLP